MQLPLDTDYGAQVALQRAARVPGHIQAIPDITSPTYTAASSQGARDAALLNVSRNTVSREAALAESAREFDLKSNEGQRQLLVRLNNVRDQMDTWAEQNKWASLLGGLNVLFQAAGSYATAKDAEKHQAILDEIVNKYTESGTSMKAFYADLLARTESETKNAPLVAEGKATPSDPWIDRDRGLADAAERSATLLAEQNQGLSGLKKSRRRR